MRPHNLSLLAFVFPMFITAQPFTSVQDGVWDDGATWGKTSPGTVGVDYPGPADDVTIDGDSVWYNNIPPFDFGGLVLETGSALVFTNGVGNVSFTSFTFNGGSIRTQTTAGRLTINDDVEVNGVMDIRSIVLVNGDFILNAGGNIAVSSAGLLRVSSSATNVIFNADVNITDGILALDAQGSNSLTINGDSDVIIDDGGTLYFEGSGAANMVNNSSVYVRAKEAVNNAVVEWVDLSGRVVQQKTIDIQNGDNTLKFDELNHGTVYLVRLITSSHQPITLKHFVL